MQLPNPFYTENNITIQKAGNKKIDTSKMIRVFRTLLFPGCHSYRVTQRIEKTNSKHTPNKICNALTDLNYASKTD